MAETVGIGIQDFGKLIGNHCFYVDKTNFIKEWWEKYVYVLQTYLSVTVKNPAMNVQLRQAGLICLYI